MHIAIYLASYIHTYMILRTVALMYSVVICTIKFKSITAGHFLSFHSRVAVQQILATYSTKMRTDDCH